MILAPLRGVTIRCFRDTFADEIRDAGFTEAITPFITAMPGYDPMKDRELSVRDDALAPQEKDGKHTTASLKVTPQFIGKDPEALRACLRRVKDAGYDTADLNAGCPFPMVRNKGRGCGLLKSPDVLRRMLEVGCEIMGEGRFSVKTRLGVDRSDELMALMPLVNSFPLRFLTVHARTARQMYEGACDRESFGRVAAAAQVPIVYNGDAALGDGGAGEDGKLMIGRGFVRCLGEGENATERLLRYLDASVRELNGDHAVLGRMKELVSYWKDLPHWRRLWPVIKLTRRVDELRAAVS